MTFTVQIFNPPFNPVQSFTAVACGTEKITLRTPASALAPITKKETENVRTSRS